MKTSFVDMKNTPSKATGMRKLYTPNSRPFSGHDEASDFLPKTSPRYSHSHVPGLIRPKPMMSPSAPLDFDRKLFSPVPGKPIGKGCNCKKSNCLKLYCDCFSRGEYCTNCNCTDCYNNEANEKYRKEAIRGILERNPNAFRPKIASGPTIPVSPIGEDILSGRHSKGCACKKSGCLKKYCECFNAGIACSESCRCVDCRNFEDSTERRTILAAVLPEASPEHYKERRGALEITPRAVIKEPMPMRHRREDSALEKALGISGKRPISKGGIESSSGLEEVEENHELKKRKTTISYISLHNKLIDKEYMKEKHRDAMSIAKDQEGSTSAEGSLLRFFVETLEEIDKSLNPDK